MQPKISYHPFHVFYNTKHGLSITDVKNRQYRSGVYIEHKYTMGTLSTEYIIHRSQIH